MSELQSFAQWVNSPIQGAIPRESPLTPADEQKLLEILTECRAKLQEVMKIVQQYPSLPDLNTGIADALQGIHEVAAVVLDPETYLE